MRGGEPEPFQAVDFIHRFQQLHERTFAIAFRKFVTAIKIHDLSKQRDFFDTTRDQVAHLPHDLVNGTAALRAARLRDNAKGAMHVASLHNGDERRGLPGCQLLVANRRLRAWFLRNIDYRKTQIVHCAILVRRELSLLVVARAGRFLRHQFFHVIGNAMKFLRPDNEIDVRQILQ